MQQLVIYGLFTRSFRRQHILLFEVESSKNCRLCLACLFAHGGIFSQICILFDFQVRFHVRRRRDVKFPMDDLNKSWSSCRSNFSRQARERKLAHGSLKKRSSTYTSFFALINTKYKQRLLDIWYREQSQTWTWCRKEISQATETKLKHHRM